MRVPVVSHAVPCVPRWRVLLVGCGLPLLWTESFSASLGSCSRLSVRVAHHEAIPLHRAVMYAALLGDFVNNCKKCLRELQGNVAESELQNARIRTKEGTEIICVQNADYTFIVIQNCTGMPWSTGEEEAGGVPAPEN